MRFLSTASLSVREALGHPMHAPWRRIETTPSVLTATNSRSPPSSCTDERMASRTRMIRSSSGAPLFDAGEFVAVIMDIVSVTRTQGEHPDSSGRTGSPYTHHL